MTVYNFLYACSTSVQLLFVYRDYLYEGIYTNSRTGCLAVKLSFVYLLHVIGERISHFDGSHAELCFKCFMLHRNILPTVILYQTLL